MFKNDPNHASVRGNNLRYFAPWQLPDQTPAASAIGSG